MSHIGPIFSISHLQPWCSRHAWFVLENTRMPLAPLSTAACWGICFAGFFNICGSRCEMVSAGGKTVLLIVTSLSRHRGFKKCWFPQKWIEPGQLSTLWPWPDSISKWQCDKLYFDQPFISNQESISLGRLMRLCCLINQIKFPWFEHYFLCIVLKNFGCILTNITLPPLSFWPNLACSAILICQGNITKSLLELVYRFNSTAHNTDTTNPRMYVKHFIEGCSHYFSLSLFLYFSMHNQLMEKGYY